MILVYTGHGNLKNLTEAYTEEKVPENFTREITAQVALGLEYTHIANGMHRDLKLVNIMVAVGGRMIELRDFGIANYANCRLMGTWNHHIPAPLQRPPIFG